MLKKLQEIGSLLMVAKAAYTIDEEDSRLLARRLRRLSQETQQQPVEELKLAA